jgi:trk system potassium uptake protein
MVTRGLRAFCARRGDRAGGGRCGDDFRRTAQAEGLSERLQGRGSRRERLRVVIFGGNEYGFSLAQMLESLECSVRIFEQDPALCARIADRLPTPRSSAPMPRWWRSLRRSRLARPTSSSAPARRRGQCDVLFAGPHAGSEELPHVDPPRGLCGGDFRQRPSFRDPRGGQPARGDAARDPAVHHHRPLPPDEAVRGSGVDRDAGGPRVDCGGHRVKEVAWPANVVLVGQLRGIHAAVPGPEDVLTAGDHLYAMVADRSLKAFAKLLDE